MKYKKGQNPTNQNQLYLDTAYKLLNMENGKCEDLEYKGLYLYGDI